MKDILFWILLIVILISILYVSQFNVDTFVDAPPAPQRLQTGDYSAYSPPSATLLTPGGIASINSLPTTDPSLEKSSLHRIKEILETANGFVQVEAPQMSDSSVQLPLTTLHADIRRMNDEVLVLQRNPGLTSTLTQHDLDEIQANLSYLQHKWRETPNAIEGFTDASGNSNARASVAQLTELITKINTAIVSLSASGATNTATQQRISKLNDIKKDLTAIISKVNSGTLTAANIPVKESDYLSFLPVVTPVAGSVPTSGTIPTLILSSLLDASGSALPTSLLSGYMDTILKGLSWNLNVNYVAERNSGTELSGAVSSLLSRQGAAVGVPYRGEFAAVTSSNDGAQVTGSGSTYAPASVQSTGARSGETTGLDWKERSNAICSAIQKRGYNPGDFGCLEDVTTVGKDFCWRGYTKMVCSRVATIYDTGAPEAVGCAPATWAGWRS